MKVYLVWLSEKWETSPELCAIFETEEGANTFRDELSSKRTKHMIEFNKIFYFVDSHEVRSSSRSPTK